jgi:DNA-binding transcriptional regulator GbsR (MarR family)
MDSGTEQFTERLGVVLERDGQTRIAGRIFALLLASDTDRSLDELARMLEVSKASVSTNVRTLEQRGVVERVSHRGDRRDYYRIAPDIFHRTMEQRLARWQRLHDALAEGRRGLRQASPSVRRRLQEFEQGLDSMMQAVTSALGEWRAANGTLAHRRRSS